MGGATGENNGKSQVNEARAATTVEGYLLLHVHACRKQSDPQKQTTELYHLCNTSIHPYVYRSI